MPYADPEKKRAAQRKYYEKNKAKKAASNAAWYQRTKPTRRAVQNAYRAEVRQQELWANLNWMTDGNTTA